MAKRKKVKSKRPSRSSGKTIRILFEGQGDPKSKVIIAAGSSNYYTSGAYTSDTCCTCES
jgi:hypothetical protein